MLQDRNLVSLPLRLAHQRSASMTTLTILKRFEFESQLSRSGVLAVDSTGDEVFFIRGAPSSIEQLLVRGNIPKDYRQVRVIFLFVTT